MGVLVCFELGKYGTIEQLNSEVIWEGVTGSANVTQSAMRSMVLAAMRSPRAKRRMKSKDDGVNCLPDNFGV